MRQPPHGFSNVTDTDHFPSKATFNIPAWADCERHNPAPYNLPVPRDFKSLIEKVSGLLDDRAIATMNSPIIVSTNKYGKKTNINWERFFKKRSGLR